MNTFADINATRLIKVYDVMSIFSADVLHILVYCGMFETSLL